MWKGVLRTARYARSWKGGANVAAHEIEIERCGVRVPATLLAPLDRQDALPGWIALGGISCMGRHHPQLVRFARALASSGAVVLVPEMPEWRRLDPTPTGVAPTVRGGVDYLNRHPEVARGPFGLIGFSFGAPQAAIASAREDIRDDICGVVLFGGYCSLERTLMCNLTGKHEWNGHDYRLSPDPFGGWVVASNYLRLVPGLEGAHRVEDALKQLAHAASGQRISAWDPRHDPLIRTLRREMCGKNRRLFDIFARPSGEPLSEPEEGRSVALALCAACRRAQPLLDPTGDLCRIDRPTQLIHGRGDRLIPFTEGFRLNEALPGAVRRGLTVTGMFHHSADIKPSAVTARVRESLRLLGAIRGLINTV